MNPVRSSKKLGVVGLAITFALNLIALFFFKLISAEFFSVYWWACWSPSYIVWLVFAVIGFARAAKNRSV
jgi:hypothetical protein